MSKIEYITSRGNKKLVDVEVTINPYNGSSRSWEIDGRKYTWHDVVFHEDRLQENIVEVLLASGSTRVTGYNARYIK